MTAVIGFIWFCALKIAGVWREPGDRPTWRWRLGALVIGVLIGLVALVAFQQLMPARILPDPPSGFEPGRLWWATVCGLPGLLGVFGLAVVYVIGVSGRQFEEDSREWWSRLGGILFGVAVGWLVVAGLAVYAPPWVMKLTGLAQGLSVAWLVTTIAGVRAAMSGSTGKPGSIGWRDRLAMITPYVFLAGLLIALAFGIHAALAAWHGDHTFTAAGHDYFGDITEWLILGGLGGAVPVHRGPRPLLLLADRRERVRVPHVLPEPARPVLSRRQQPAAGEPSLHRLRRGRFRARCRTFASAPTISSTRR